MFRLRDIGQKRSGVKKPFRNPYTGVNNQNANETSDKFGPVDICVPYPYDLRNNLICYSTLFMHFEILRATSANLLLVHSQ